MNENSKVVDSKEELWKHEEPILILKKKIWGKGYFYFPRKLAREFDLDKNSVVLFRITFDRSLICLSKISEIRCNYVLKINSDVLRRLKIELPNILTLEFLQFKKRGSRPELKKLRNCIDVVEYTPRNVEFTCFERPFGFLTIYYLKKFSPSIITFKRYVNINKLFLWNIGFYLAEGEKATNYRFGVSNTEMNLVKLFRDCGENCFGIDRNDWCAELKLKNKSEKIVKYWANNLNLNEEKMNVRIIKNKPPESKFGALSLVFYNRILGEINKNIIYDIGFIKRLNINEKLFILRGLEAGDGTVMKKSGCIEVGIVCQKKEMEIVRCLFSSVCSKDPYIRRSWTCDKIWFVFYRGIEMAKEYILDGHFIEHKKRRKKLIGLYKFYKTKELLCLNLILNERFTVNDLSKYLGITYRATNVRLKDLMIRGFLISKQNKLFKNNRFYNVRKFFLTTKGKEYVNYFF